MDEICSPYLFDIMKASTLFLLFQLVYFNVASCFILDKDYKPNIFVLTDISNEPDDAQSLVRLLLYSNELSIKGIVATTSYWLNYTVHDEDIYPILNAYEKVHPNLLKHSIGYPSPDYLRSIVSIGHPVYGLDAFNYNEISEGAKNLIAAVDNTNLNERMFVLVWGGAAVLAEALKHISSRPEQAIEQFVLKLGVYSISDQDDAGPWIRNKFPSLLYISSVHGFNQYGLSTWVGISGEKYNPFDFGGPDTSLVTKEWLNENIRSVGPLGAVYPEPMFIMEGDTPATLFVLPNGLNVPENPNFGSWGGRYSLFDQSGRSNHYADATDYVVGQDNRTHVSNKATIWRWREAYQNDFAARMQWTIVDFESAVHAPIIVVNKTNSVKPFSVEASVESKIFLDASESYDLNNRPLSFKWFHYRDVTLTQGNIEEVPEIEINKLNEDGSVISFTTPSFSQACLNIFGRPNISGCKSYHIILEVTNNGTPALRSYRRFIIYTDKGEEEIQEVEFKQSFFNAENKHDEL